MVEETKNNKVEKEVKKDDVKVEKEVKKDDVKVEKDDVKVEKDDVKVEGEVKKSAKTKDIPKKDVAVANGYSLKISPKQSKYICKLLMGKTPNAAIDRLQAVIDKKRPVPMAGLEVGHKRGIGLTGGKFPKNACIGIIEIVKQAGANAIVVGIENPVIVIASANRASAPFRKAGRRAKRTHLHIELRDKKWLVKNKSKKGGKK